MTAKLLSKKQFLKDVFLCALASYGGPEAHYGVFQHQLIEKKSYITEEELAELIGLFSIVPGPSSTQTITAVGYHLGGKKLALLTFLIWVSPAILMMSSLGLFFQLFKDNQLWQSLVRFLPAVAIGFIVYAAINMTRKTVKRLPDLFLYIGIAILAYFTLSWSVWMIFIFLMLAGLINSLPHWSQIKEQWHYLGQMNEKPQWIYLVMLFAIAIILELAAINGQPLMTLLASFYRYGYSVIGGGQLIIPMMIEDFVKLQTVISQSDFLAGYAFDQAVPGPLFSFAAFVASRAFSQSIFALLIGIVGGFTIFLPGTLLVYFMTPLWQTIRKFKAVSYFLKGVTIAVAALITLTAISQTLTRQDNILDLIMVLVTTLLLLSKKVPAPIIIIAAMLLGFFYQG
ncbi:hypothetical protein A9Q68_01835 [Streptococcus bovimastitidis]|uniref:Chromate transporter n=1 Tax=Streptococcus bovimastitidis TaxID=1856638 RepID=A0A1L8MNG3_9STRE|nr:chromate efflux transporter [Streptococcus bovimastitidis]OJF72310.1 hypothetical protein A9Q68_01835 [Streptococcus bovimastitidis]